LPTTRHQFFGLSN